MSAKSTVMVLRSVAVRSINWEVKCCLIFDRFRIRRCCNLFNEMGSESRDSELMGREADVILAESNAIIVSKMRGRATYHVLMPKVKLSLSPLKIPGSEEDRGYVLR